MKLNGIKRNTSLLNEEDGFCTELINARYINKEWQGIQPPTVKYSFPTVGGGSGKWYDHKATSNDKIIWWDSASSNLYEVDMVTDTKTVLKNIASVTKIYEFGTVLIVMTSTDAYYLKYTETGYIELGDITHGRYRFDDTEREAFADAFTPIDTSNYINEGIAKVTEHKRNLELAGKINAHVFFRLAFKTTDGNYIFYSPIFYRYIGYDEQTDGAANIGTVPSIRKAVASITEYFYYWGNWGKPQFHLYFSAAQVALLKEYKGQIESLCLFMSNPHYDWDYTSTNLIPFTDTNGNTFNFYPHTEGIEKHFNSANSFYLVEQIPIIKLDDITVTGESFDIHYTVSTQLANKNIYEKTVVVKSTDGTITYVEGTDYQVDYLNGTISPELFIPAVEVFTTGASLPSTITLLHQNISSLAPPVITNGSVTYVENTDYTVDYVNGLIVVLSTGTMVVSTSYNISYAYRSMADGVTYKIDYRHYLSYVLELGDISTLMTKTSLPVDSFTSHKYFSDIVYEYNSRLHYGDVQTKLGNIPNLTVYDTNSQNHLPANYVMQYDISELINVLYALVTLDTGDGTRYVLTKWVDIGGASDNLFAATLNQVITYPDQRATNIKFLWFDGTNYLNSGLDVKLKTSIYGNYAYSIPDVSLVVTNVSYGTGMPVEVTLRVLKYNMLINQSSGTYALPTINSLLQDKNRLQVSELNNLLYFPAKNSYRIGRLTSTIVGISSQAMEVSTGQFGQYPVYVFTTEGIKALEPGISVLYQSIKPISLQACNNPDSVTQIEGGIIFSTDYGLFVISGSEVKEISIPVEGIPETFINADTHYLAAVAAFPTGSTALSTTPFKTFLKTAKIEYDRVNKEIIVTNGYTYHFSVVSGEWYKSQYSYNYYFNRGNNLYGITGSNVYSLGDPDNTVSNQVIIVTRPIRFKSNGLKTISRAILRVTENNVTDNLSLYLYGSLDGVNWKFIQGKDITNYNAKETVLELPKTTARYFIFFIALQGTIIRMGDIDVDIKQVDNNKLR